jgi:hypothetical protein
MNSLSKLAKPNRVKALLIFSLISLGTITWLYMTSEKTATRSEHLEIPPKHEISTISSSVSAPVIDKSFQSDPIRAAAANRPTSSTTITSVTTDCVVLMVAYRNAMKKCSKDEGVQACALNDLKDKGFDPSTYDMCKLFRPSATTSPFN